MHRPPSQTFEDIPNGSLPAASSSRQHRLLRADNAIDHLLQIRLMYRLGGCEALQRRGVASPPWIIHHV